MQAVLPTERRPPTPVALHGSCCSPLPDDPTLLLLANLAKVHLGRYSSCLHRRLLPDELGQCAQETGLRVPRSQRPTVYRVKLPSREEPRSPSSTHPMISSSAQTELAHNIPSSQATSEEAAVTTTRASPLPMLVRQGCYPRQQRDLPDCSPIQTS